MKTIAALIFCLMPVAASADCLKVDLLAVDNSAMHSIPVFHFEAHNECRTSKPDDHSKNYSVNIAFYDKDGARLGFGRVCVGTVEAGEKVRHQYDVPYDVRHSGVAVTIKVKSITEENLCF